MKRQYTYVKPHTVKACKEMAKVLINHDFEDNSLTEPSYYEYKISRIFEVGDSDFRLDFEEWITNYMIKQHLL